MSFVGTRPEAVKYVKKYKPEYMAIKLFRNFLIVTELASCPTAHCYSFV